MFGLDKGELLLIQTILADYPEIERAVVFGSRAMGNNKAGSDFDLALLGKDVSHGTILSIYDQLNEISNLPYYFDITNYKEILNEPLKKHIHDFGIPIWDKHDKTNDFIDLITKTVIIPSW